jgi:hypothetical protein
VQRSHVLSDFIRIVIHVVFVLLICFVVILELKVEFGEARQSSERLSQCLDVVRLRQPTVVFFCLGDVKFLE